MRILIISQMFPPEVGAGAARVTDLAKEWYKAGHDITILTGFPNYPADRSFFDSTEKRHCKFLLMKVSGKTVVIFSFLLQIVYSYCYAINIIYSNKKKTKFL